MNCPGPAAFDNAADALKKWNHFAGIEEQMFKQKSRIRWLQQGDRNTGFFHRTVQTRNSKNSIKRLQNAAGYQLSTHADIKDEAINHFVALLKPQPAHHTPIHLQSLQQLIRYRCSTDTASLLKALVSPEEIKSTLLSLPRNKSPGPDGFTVEFFVACWATVGNDFTAAIQSFFEFGILPTGVNATKLILIPKSNNAETIKDYRPIACCNTTYKVISKILANRLKKILPEAILKNQCAFVKGRMLLENVLLATELVKNYHKKDISARCVLKLDISKAFDTVRWDFIVAALQAMALPEMFIGWIMCCISTASFSVSLNGNLEGFFTSSRGIRQGCSLSPYIFVIVMNVLSLHLNAAADSARIGYHPYCRDIKLTHLCFADDLMVFLDGQADSLANTMQVLEDFHQISGLRINPAKSSIYAGGKTQISLINSANDLSIPMHDLPIRYLGLPLTTKNMTKVDYAPLIDRIKNRLMAWSAKTLSYAGRLQLIAAVIKSITDFWSSAFRLPSRCFRVIDGMCAAFLWSGSPFVTTKAKVSWAEVCVPKAEGGLGLRRLKDTSQVFSLSLIWRLLSNAGSLWVAWVKRYLLQHSNFWEVKHTSRGSWIWRKLLKMRPLAQSFIRLELNSGMQFLFWLDNWMNKRRLIDVLGDHGIRRMGIRRTATVSEVTVNGCWYFNRCRDPTIRGIIREIQAIQPPSPTASSDRTLWKHDENVYKSQFSSKKTWIQIRQTKPRVSWHRLVWFGLNIPRQAFITWLAIRNRLPTGDRARRWGQDQDCKLCGEGLETRSHLFFACPFSFTVWTSIVAKLLSRTDPDWTATLAAASGRRLKKIDSLLVRLAFQATIYYIWRERNNRRHGPNRGSTMMIITMIKRDIGNRLQPLSEGKSEELRKRWNEITG